MSVTYTSTPVRGRFTATVLSLMLLGAWPAVLPAAAPDGGSVFIDDFTTGPVTDAGASAAGFWTVRAPQGAFATKSDGVLKLESAGPAQWANLHLISALRPDFNFFARPLTFSLEDLAVTASEGVPPERATMRFSVTPAVTQEWLGDTGVSLSLNAARRLRLGYKVATPQKDPDSANMLVEHTFAGDVTGIDVTLDADGYALAVRHKDERGEPAATPFTTSGKWTDKGPGLTKDSWGGDGSAVMLLAQRGQIDPPADTNAAVITLSAFKVNLGQPTTPSAGTTTTEK
ncbi:MAG TPA: hypothetical protein VGN72_13365 [Tepidisphaeraceae bacterium]|jgi:hypothetical protein|nr:hypothetical protein [Tepidisphaeraceae bacterium]